MTHAWFDLYGTNYSVMGEGVMAYASAVDTNNEEIHAAETALSEAMAYYVGDRITRWGSSRRVLDKPRARRSLVLVPTIADE